MNGREQSDTRRAGNRRSAIEYRALLYRLAQRDLLLRYKQAVMGFAWAVFMPLLNTSIFTIIFTRVARVQTSVPYLVYAYCGLLFWNFTASALKGAVTSLSTNATLVTRCTSRARSFRSRR